jgi:hypothetical protein
MMFFMIFICLPLSSVGIHIMSPHLLLTHFRMLGNRSFHPVTLVAAWWGRRHGGVDAPVDERNAAEPRGTLELKVEIGKHERGERETESGLRLDLILSLGKSWAGSKGLSFGLPELSLIIPQSLFWNIPGLTLVPDDFVFLVNAQPRSAMLGPWAWARLGLVELSSSE